MIVGIKDSVKLIGVAIISCCAVLVCTMFLNYYLDVVLIENEVQTEIARIFYKAQLSTAKVVCMVTGGCLLITSAITLLFYIKHYIDTHKKELGILKALGYSNLKIAKSFWAFGISIFVGTAIGFCGAFLIMPEFYELQNKEKLLPEFTIHFHPVIFICFVIIPTIVFSLLSVLYAWTRLKRPVLSLIKNEFQNVNNAKKHRKDKISGGTFIGDLKRNTLRNKKVLIFFIVFAAFCFSAMTQMSFSMKDLSSEMMGVMMLIIGLVLAFTTLFICVTTVINGNKKAIAMMRVLGYSQKECSRAILGVYRPLSYIGFVIGTIYQYVLLRIMVDIVFKDMESVPAYEFDFPVMFISLAVFILAYEIIMYIYSKKLKELPSGK